MGHGRGACTPEGPWTGFKMDLCKCVITQAVQIYGKNTALPYLNSLCSGSFLEYFIPTLFY